MEIVVSGRNCDLSDRFRGHTEEKLSKLEKLDQRIIRVNVEVVGERNPRQADRAVRVQLTALSKGPVIRAEAAAGDKMSALDLALDKLTTQMRRAADRRRASRRGGRAPVSVGQMLASDPPPAEVGAEEPAAETSQAGPIEVTGYGPLVVREKTHNADPMTLDQALFEMELVGHDFFLFVEKETERPSVVYRRRGYDYGVISLVVGAG